MSGPSMAIIPGQDGGGLNYTLISANTINATLVTAGAGMLLDLSCFTNAGTIGYLRLYDKATAPATTDGALCIWEGIIPGVTGGAGFIAPIKRRFLLGLGFILSGGIALNDNTAVAANAFTVNIGYLLAASGLANG